jgi:hypothetical protein
MSPAQGQNGSEQDFLVTMAAGTTSGLLARIPLHPLDTIKAKLQVRRVLPRLFYRPKAIVACRMLFGVSLRPFSPFLLGTSVHCGRLGR